MSVSCQNQSGFLKKRLLVRKFIKQHSLCQKYEVYEINEEENDVCRMRIHPSKMILMWTGFVFICFPFSSFN